MFLQIGGHLKMTWEKEVSVVASFNHLKVPSKKVSPVGGRLILKILEAELLLKTNWWKETFHTDAKKGIANIPTS